MARRRKVLRAQQGVVFVWQGEIRRLKNGHGARGQYGRTITGFDEDRNDIRTFYRRDIERYIAINTQSVRRSTTKKAPLFQRLRRYRFLRMRADAGGGLAGALMGWPHVSPVCISSASVTRLGQALSRTIRCVNCWASRQQMNNTSPGR